MRFIDTNVLVYAYDTSDRAKTAAAHTLLERALISGAYAISTQVVSEFCNVALKKAQLALTSGELSDILKELLLPLLAHQPDGGFYERVLQTYDRYSLSYYDAAIVQAALDLGCDTLYSEDMQAGVRYGSLMVVNPFADVAAI